MQARPNPSTHTKPLRLLLATLVVAVAGTLAQTAQARPFGPPPGGMEGSMMQGPGMLMLQHHHLQRLLDSVNASAEQRTQINQILQAARADLRAQRDAGRTTQEQGQALFAAPTIDANAVEALRLQMLAQHDQASKRLTQALLDVSRVLTAEQRKAMVEQLNQRREMAQRHRAERQGARPPPPAQR